MVTITRGIYEIPELIIPDKTPSKWIADLFRDEQNLGMLRILASSQVQMIPKTQTCVCPGRFRMALDRQRMWRCHTCKYSKSALRDTIFFDSKMGIFKSISLLNHIAADCNFTQMEHLVAVSSKSASRFARKVRNELFCSWNFDLKLEKIGGEGYEVELDETAFGEVKFDIGRPPARGTRWIFGGERK